MSEKSYIGSRDESGPRLVRGPSPGAEPRRPGSMAEDEPMGMVHCFEQLVDSLHHFKQTRHLIPELRRNHRLKEIEEYLEWKGVIAEAAIPAFWHVYEEQIRREAGLPPAPPADPLVRIAEPEDRHAGCSGAVPGKGVPEGSIFEEEEHEDN